MRAAPAGDPASGPSAPFPAAPALLAALAAALLAGCRAADTGRYALAVDRAPSAPVDAADIAEVAPEPVRRTRAGNRSPYTVLGRTYEVLPTEEGYSACGVASWYGEKFHGRRTANGEIFDMYRVSAAHRTLPIPSFARVTNLDNGRRLIVRVNDRGPFRDGRIIDLSWAAALKLGYAGRGTARVRVDAVTVDGNGRVTTAGEEPPLAGRYLQVGAFARADRAIRLADRLRAMTGHPVFVRRLLAADGAATHQVRVGPFAGEDAAGELADRIVAAGLGRPYTVAE